MKKTFILLTIILICLLGGIFTLVNINQKIENKLYEVRKNEPLMKEDELTITGQYKTNWAKGYNTISTVNNKSTPIYSLSVEKTNLKVGDKLKYKTTASDQLFIHLRYAYPYYTLTTTKENHYKATQMALYNLAFRTGEANLKDKKYEIDELKELLGEENEEVIQMAKEKVSASENIADKNLVLKPSLSFDDEDIKWSITNDKRKIGPYYYNLIFTEEEDIKISVLKDNGKEIPAAIVDEDDNYIENLEKSQTFYIIIPKDIYSYKLNITAQFNRLLALIYEDENLHDYLVSAYIKDELNKNKGYEITVNEKEEEGTIKPNEL